MKAGIGITLAATVLAWLFVAASPAAAGVRYASPSGTPSLACSSSAPCDLQSAVEMASDGDEVVVNPGSYAESDELDVSAAILVRGQAGDASPVVVSTAATAVKVTSPGALIRGLTIVHSGSADALLLDAGFGQQLTVRSSGTEFACDVLGATLRDSFCISSGTGGRGVGMSAAGTTDYTYLRNVTAVATGPSSEGLRVEASIGGVAKLTGYNVIARGAGVDIISKANDSAFAEINLDHSNYASRSVIGTKSFAPAPGVAFNQTDPPLFVDAANGNFHEADESPTIDHGTQTFGWSSEDVDGQTRVQLYGIDIGADEYVLQSVPGDLNPPDTKIIRGPAARTSHHRAKFKFGTTEPAGATIMCSLDGAAYKPCESPKGYRVKPGVHTFRVYSIDAAGNVDPTPDHQSWRVKRKRAGGGGGDGGLGGGGGGAETDALAAAT
jgi:hypothetical protein